MSELNYRARNCFLSDILLAIEMKIAVVLMNKSVQLGLSVWKICKMVMYDFCFDYVKPKYTEK